MPSTHTAQASDGTSHVEARPRRALAAWRATMPDGTVLSPPAWPCSHTLQADAAGYSTSLPAADPSRLGAREKVCVLVRA
jgi:hypothetical protein